MMSIPATWLATVVVCGLAILLTTAVWLSEDDSLVGLLRWPWHDTFPLVSVANAALLALVGLSILAFSPSWRNSSTASGRSLLPLRGRSIIFYTWLILNVAWFIAGIRERDFQKKPKWLKRLPPISSSTSSSSSSSPTTAILSSYNSSSSSYVPMYGDAALRALRVSYGVGMAACWPLLANLFVVLLPADRSLFLLACLGVGHEDGVLAHALCGTAVWIWASVHALLTQAPMLAAGLWRVIMLPAWDGTETKGTSNCMGLMAWLCLCVLGLSSLAPLRRRVFNAFQWLHIGLAPAVLLLGCLHDSKVFWYAMLGAVLYGADVVQRWVVRRRAAVAVATVYPPLDPVPTAAAAAARTSAAAAAAVVATGSGKARAVPAQVANTETAKAPEEGGFLHVSVIAAAASAAAAASGEGAMSGGSGSGCGGGASKFVVLRIPTRGPPGCFAGQHVWVKVPKVSRWEWHPYSVAAHNSSSFALVVKAGGDWERRLCRLVERTAASAAAASAGASDPGGSTVSSSSRSTTGGSSSSCGSSALIDVEYEGLYGTPDLGVAAAAADRVLLFAGGAGITPVASVLQSLLLRGTISSSPSCSFRDFPRVAGGTPPFGLNGGGEAAGQDAAAAARVRLVWAVTRLADAQPLMPLLCAAASRGCLVDIYCTRVAPPPPPSQSGGAPSVGPPPSPRLLPPHPTIPAATSPPAQTQAPTAPQQACTSSNSDSSGGGSGPVSLTIRHHTYGGLQQQQEQQPARRLETSGSAAAATPAPAPWQLNGAACWAVAACSAAAAAVGRNLGSTLAYTYSCAVSASDGLDLGSGGSGGGGGDGGIHAWVASVRAAFQQQDLGPPVATSFLGGLVGAIGRLIATAVTGGADGGFCPDSFDPAKRPLLGSSGGATDQSAAKVALRVCRLAIPGWPLPYPSPQHDGVEAGVGVGVGVIGVGGVRAPLLCVKCDPFVTRTPLEAAWPCCTAPACFFAPRLALVCGWVLGALAGAAVACWVWRRWAAAAAGAVGASASGSRRRGGGGGGRGWLLSPVMDRMGRRKYAHGVVSADVNSPLLWQGGTAGHLAAAAGGGAAEGAGWGGGGVGGGTEALLTAAEEGGAGRGGGGSGGSGIAAGLEGMFTACSSNNDVSAVSGDGAGFGSSVGSGGGSGSGGEVRVHAGRPDVESYIRTAVSSGVGTVISDGYGNGYGGSLMYGGGRGSTCSGLMYGVVVCGPESLQADVQSAYGRYVVPVVAARGGGSSWFRGFSFTT